MEPGQRSRLLERSCAADEVLPRPVRRARGRLARRAFGPLGLLALGFSSASLAWLGGLGRREARGREEKPELPIMDVDFVELQVPQAVAQISYQTSRLYVPVIPEVATWMNQSDLDFSYSAVYPLTGRPHIHVTVTGRPFQLANVTIQGIHTAIELPDPVQPNACKVAVIRAEAKLGPGPHTVPTHAVLLVCQVHERGESLPISSKILLPQGHPMRWLLLPWLLLLLPFLVGSSLGPFALLGGAALTLASIACLSFLIAVFIVIIQRRCLHCTRRWRRLWRLRMLQRRPSRIATAFGDSGPCCICLGESDSRDMLIALLPCRHALHAECYANWVSADAYPSSHLICPVCRCGAEAIGKLPANVPAEP